MVNALTEHLDIWTTAQTAKTNGRGNGSVTQSQYGVNKLRELILDLAVRGKLVPQDPNDESASVLLQKIYKEKARLVEEGIIREQKAFARNDENEKPFELPINWKWARVADIGHDWGQKKPDNDFTYIEVSGIDNVRGIISSPNVLTAAEAPSRARKVVKLGTIIYSTVRPYLKNICVIDREYSPEPIASTAFAVLHPFQQMPGRFFAIFLRSPVFVKYVESIQTGIAYPAINDSQFFNALIPVPPLAEQQRIVTKVDELMTLCDLLEQRQADSNNLHQILLETLLDALTGAIDPIKSAEAWKFIVNNFDTLFTTEDSIDQLKQTILGLAVMGKLVLQDPNDEPASVLLEKISKEKTRLVEEYMLKKQELLPDISEDEKPFELPVGWKWARLQEVIDVRDGTHDSPKDAIGPDTYPLVTSKNFYAGTIKFDEARRISPEDHLEISKRSSVERYDILFSMIGGNLGNQVMVDDDRPFSVKNVALFKYYDKKLTSPFFVKKFLEHLALDLQSKAAGGAQPFVSLGFLRNLVIAVPPAEEQKRIVAKIDELMIVCDALKSRLKEIQATQVQLADAVVEQALT